MDVYTTLGLVPKLRTREGSKIAPAVARSELPLEPVLAKMEYDGIRIDQSLPQRTVKTAGTIFSGD